MQNEARCSSSPRCRRYSAHHEYWRRGSRICRPAARRRVRGGGRGGDRGRHRSAQGRRDHSRRLVYRGHPLRGAARRAAEGAREHATTRRWRGPRPIIICVPTPLTDNREPDLGPLEASAEALARVVQEGQLVVLESTTYPGTTRELLVPVLERALDAQRRRDPQRRVLTRARRSGAHGLHAQEHAEGDRRYHRGMHRPRRRALRRACATTSCASPRPRRRR